MTRNSRNSSLLVVLLLLSCCAAQAREESDPFWKLRNGPVLGPGTTICRLGPPLSKVTKTDAFRATARLRIPIMEIRPQFYESDALWLDAIHVRSTLDAFRGAFAHPALQRFTFETSRSQALSHTAGEERVDKSQLRGLNRFGFDMMYGSNHGSTKVPSPVPQPGQLGGI